MYVSIILIALAVSLDSCSVGLLYGTRKIRIPWISIVIISICSGFVIWSSMKLSILLMSSLDQDLAQVIGACILILVGVWAVLQIFLHHRKEPQPVGMDHQYKPTPPSRMLFKIEIRKIGLVIQILKSPAAADFDRSGTISSGEATLLGIALSLDALGAGIGAAMLGYSPLYTSLIIAFSGGLFITIGLRLGEWLSTKLWMQRFSLLPGLLLITLGIMKLF